MSMHQIPLTDLEKEGLTSHGLPVGSPSMLSDAFRSGIAWGLKNEEHNSSRLLDVNQLHGWTIFKLDDPKTWPTEGQLCLVVDQPYSNLPGYVEVETSMWIANEESSVPSHIFQHANMDKVLLWKPLNVIPEINQIIKRYKLGVRT